MSGPYDKIPDEPDALRQAIVDLSLAIKQTDHIGRINRLFGWRHDLQKRLVAIGGNSEREVLPLLNHPSGWVRYSAAYVVKPCDRPLFIATLEALVNAGGDVGFEAKHSLSDLEFFEKLAQSPRSSGPGPYAHLARWQENNPPPPPMVEEELRKLIGISFRGDIVTKLMSLVRPAVDLWPNAKTTPPLLGSRLGGIAVAPPEWEWPMSYEEPHYFLAQIDCSELGGLPGTKLLPKQGMLSFFADHDVLAGCTGGADAASIFYWPDTEILRPAVSPLPLSEERLQEAILFRPRLDLPDHRSDAIRKLGLSTEQEGVYSTIRNSLVNHGIPKEVHRYIHDRKLLGWPTYIQDEFEIQPQSGANPWRLLLELGCHIGPGGDIYFMMREGDLAARSFDRCQSIAYNT